MMRNLLGRIAAIFALLLAFLPADVQATYHEPPNVSNSTGTLSVANGGTGATTSGGALDSLTGASGNVAGVTQRDYNASYFLNQKSKKSRALRTFWAALGNRATAPCNIITVGTSITEGYPPGGTPSAIATNQAWHNVFLNELRTQFPTTGAPGTFGYYAVYHEIAAPSDYPVVNTGGSTGNAAGLGLRDMFLNGAGQHEVFTAPTNATSVDVVWWQFTSTTSFNWKQNGGSPTTVSTTGADQDWHTTHISPVAAGDTIEVDYVSGAGVFIDGFFAYGGDESSGIRGYDSGQAGVATSTFIAAGTTRWFRAFNQINPALVTIELGPNDWATLTPAQFQTNLQTLVTDIEAQSSPSIVLFADWQVGTGGANPWYQYLDAMQNIANGDPNIVFMDMNAVMVKTSAVDTVGGMLPDSTHAGPAGSIVVGDTLLNFVRPNAP